MNLKTGLYIRVRFDITEQVQREQEFQELLSELQLKPAKETDK